MTDHDERERGKTERSEVAEDHAGDEIEGGHEAAEHEGEQYGDGDHGERDDMYEVAIGCGADVVEARCLAGDAVGDGT